MTTQETIQRIREGIALIPNSLSETHMLSNKNFSQGYLAASFAHHTLSSSDWKILMDEINQAVELYKEKYTK